MATLKINPSSPEPGSLVDVDGAGFDPKGEKYRLTTTDANGFEVGQDTNRNRVRRDGTFSVGIKVPPVEGPSYINAYQGTTKVVAPITVKKVVVEPVPEPVGKSIRVASIEVLRSALSDDTIDEIIVVNGTYRISASNRFASNSLWIGGPAHPAFNYAKRTRPVLVRAESVGGVVFDGGGGSAFGGLSFQDGAHDQTWDGFRFANMGAESTGIIEFGGYSPRQSPYNITLRNITIDGTCKGRATTSSGTTLDHGVYFAHALGSGPNNILIENLTVDGTGNLASALHWYHGDSTAPGTHHVVVRNLRVNRTQSAIIMAVTGLHDITIEGAYISDARRAGVQYFAQSGGQKNILFKDVISVRSGVRGWDGPTNPVGVTFVNCSFQ